MLFRSAAVVGDLHEQFLDALVHHDARGATLPGVDPGDVVIRHDLGGRA